MQGKRNSAPARARASVSSGGWRGTAERGEFGAAFVGPAVHQQQRAGPLEPGVDALPAGQGLRERPVIAVEPAGGANAAKLTAMDGYLLNEVGRLAAALLAEIERRFPARARR